MKILISSHFFHPSIGGIEEVSGILADEFCAAGHEVKVVTQTEAASTREFPFQIHRRPSAWELLELVRWCDVYLHNQISLQTAWPLLLVSRPWVIGHHTWTQRVDGRLGWRDRLKLRILRSARNIAVSRAIAERTGVPAEVIGNPYREGLFREVAGVARERDLIFVGRHVSDKGGDLLVRAVAALRAEGVFPSVTMVGQGPEEEAWAELATKLCVGSQFTFCGAVSGDALVKMLNGHRIMVVPSKWEEPFGLVALEGIACGCVVVAADGGGLPEAVGPCGVQFERGNVDALTSALREVLAGRVHSVALRAKAEAHLQRHRPSAVAARYLEVLNEEHARWS